MDQNDPAKIVSRAIAAKNLRTNTFLRTVLESRRADIIQQWEAAGTPEAREQAWQALRSLNELAGAIENECKRAIKRADDLQRGH